MRLCSLRYSVERQVCDRLGVGDAVGAGRLGMPHVEPVEHAEDGHGHVAAADLVFHLGGGAVAKGCGHDTHKLPLVAFQDFLLRWG